LATYPQIGQATAPVVGSTSRKLAHPLVRQKVRPAAVEWVERRRIRRMELDRPAKADVAVLVIMGMGSLWCFLRAVRRCRCRRQRWCCVALDSP